MRSLCILLACILLRAALMAAGREVAIIIDDVPRGGDGGAGEPDPPAWVHEAWAAR